MKTTSSTTSLIACAVIIGAFTAGFASGPASAQGSPARADKFQFRFEYEPAELANAASAEKLLVRLEHDVRARCDGFRKMDLPERKRVEACINATMKSTIAGFGSDTVMQAYADGIATRAGG